MAERPLIILGSPQPITPKKRGGQLQDLLSQFASQSSAESATKLRRISSQDNTKRRETVATSNGASKRSQREQSRPPHRAFDSSTSANHLSATSSPDHQISTPDNTKVLKMEKRKKEREHTGSLRRSTRDRKSAILESDTLPATSPSRKAPIPSRKLDTTRARLRDDIAHKSKAKANNFLVANKEYFLPLLPPNNHVAKLLARGNANPVVDYKDILEQPEGVKATLKPYQLSGLSYLVYLYRNGFSGILGDEMGLGKTLQTLSLFQYLEEMDQKNGKVSEELRPYLVICPLSVLSSWMNEAQKWVPELRVLRFHGAASERDHLKRVAVGLEDYKGNETAQATARKASRKAGQKVGKLTADDRNSGSYKIIVTTYDTFQAEESWFKHSFVWRYVVLDEGHKIKSSVTQISMALKNISTEYRLILTGTPLQNNLVEMWALLTWLYPDVFVENTAALFKESFDLTKGRVDRMIMDHARRLLELIMLRRMKDSPSVNLGLPPKEEVLLYVPLTPLQRFWYTKLLTRIDNGMLNELFADGKNKEKIAIEQDREETAVLERAGKLEQQHGLENGQDDWEETTKIMQAATKEDKNEPETKGAWKKLMNLVMQLRKCCSHPYLLPGVEPDPYYLGEHIIRSSGKFILLEKLIRYTIFEQDKKVLIFSGFTRTLDYTEELLSLISNRGERFKFLRFDGSTSRARRNLDIRLFNQDKSDYKVMLLSTRAGGLGINLTSAQDVIFLDEDWNPQITLQAEARAHRIGQTKKVTIYKLCTQGTVEEQMMGRIRKKLYLSAKITESMQSIHDRQSSKKAAPRSSLADDMPQMDTSQLMSLVRRGAQTLSHPEIDAREMLSWDLETMLAKCRDKPADNAIPGAALAEADEDKWLSVMERVECAVLDGKRYQRKIDDSFRGNTSVSNILPDNITREDRRKGKNTTVMVDGYAVSKASMGCADWEAVPTLAGKDARLADPVRDKRRQYNHEDHCLVCFEGQDLAHMVECKSCPRAYHFDCLPSEYQSKVKGFSGFFCAQHKCCDCGRSTSDAGGLIFRCRWCPQGFCEDCLDWDKTEIIGENLPEFELLGEEPTSTGFYIKCPTCIDAYAEDDEQDTWVKGMEANYKKQHDIWLQYRAETQLQLEQRRIGNEEQTQGAAGKNAESVEKNSRLNQGSQFNEAPTQHRVYITTDDDGDDMSPPALTDTSVPTPALGGSRVSTPNYTAPPQATTSLRKRLGLCEPDIEKRSEKKARLDT